jgi:RHS repeat-associated protein
MSKPLSSVLGSIATYVYGRYIDEVLQMQRCGTGILPVDCTTGVPPVDYYYHTDDLYNVMAVTDGAGNVVERYEYDDYGTPMVMAPDGTVFASSTIGNPYLFTGRRYDAETSWYHYRTRYLDPAAGRFTTRDTIGIWGDPWELGNGYTYVENNPRSWIDPWGLFAGSANGNGGQIPPRCEGDAGRANQPGRLPGVFDKNNPCHQACKKGAKNADGDFTSKTGASKCLSKCLQQCDAKQNSGHSPNQGHAREFWRYNPTCGSKFGSDRPSAKPFRDRIKKDRKELEAEVAKREKLRDDDELRRQMERKSNWLPRGATNQLSSGGAGANLANTFLGVSNGLMLKDARFRLQEHRKQYPLEAP